MNIEEIIASMTLEEKASLCSGRDFWMTQDYERLGIPKVMMCDGSNGLRKQPGEADHLGINKSIETICYPTASAVAASFDVEMLEELGHVLGQECQAEKVGLHGVTPNQADKVWIAYEPVWAIGVNGVPATREYAQEKHGVIRDCVQELFGEETGARVPLLYGGSVNPQNAPELIQMENIDGLFIGRSAWQAENFNTIIRSVIPLWQKK